MTVFMSRMVVGSCRDLWTLACDWPARRPDTQLYEPYHEANLRYIMSDCCTAFSGYQHTLQCTYQLCISS